MWVMIAAGCPDSNERGGPVRQLPDRDHEEERITGERAHESRDNLPGPFAKGGIMVRHFPFTKFLLAAIGLLAVLGVAACNSSSGGGGGGGAGSTGSSSAGAPDSLIGLKLVQTITDSDGKPTTIPVGDTITYQFIDSQTILGEGMNTVPTTSWSYQVTSGNTATVQLNYVGGATEEKLTFTSDNGGTFHTTGALNSGTTAWYSGTFVVSGLDGGSGGGSGDSSGGSGGTSGGDGGTAPPACETNQTGTLTFWVSNPTGGTVHLTVSGLGSRSTSQYWNSAPECGGTGTGYMTFTDVPAGSYPFNASDDIGTWSGTANVNTCSCTNFELM